MRLPSFPNLLRTIYTVSNATTRLTTYQLNALAPSYIRAASLRGSSMPIPILSSLFSSAPSRNMTHPVQKSDNAWQAVLNPGEQRPPPTLSDCRFDICMLRWLINGFAEQFRILREKGTEAPYTCRVPEASRVVQIADSMLALERQSTKRETQLPVAVGKLKSRQHK